MLARSPTTTPGYYRHQPEQTELYSVIAKHYPRLVDGIERSGGYLPKFVRQEFEDYLKCGLLEHGFLRVKCDSCCHEHLGCLDLEPGSSLDHLQAASINYRIAIGPHAGRKALALFRVPPLRETTNNPLLARASGFSLHAATVCEAWQRSRLERLCRYITRPPIATKRLSVDGRGRVIYRYKHPFQDGSTHVVLEPLDFIARLAALVPRPRVNLTRFHGVFAPNFKHREHIVPQRTQRTVEGDKPVAPMSWMQRLKRVFAIDIETCPERRLRRHGGLRTAQEALPTCRSRVRWQAQSDRLHRGPSTDREDTGTCSPA